MNARWLLVLAMAFAGCSRTPTLSPEKASLLPKAPPLSQILVSTQSNVQQASALMPTEPPDLQPSPSDFGLPAPPQRTEEDLVAEALGRIGPAAVPGLVEVLHGSNLRARLQAVEVLGRMGPDAKDATPELIPLLDDPDEGMRKAAARTLGLIGPEASAAVPMLIRALVEPTARK